VHPLKNLHAFYGTRRFITVFTRAIHWSLSWARSIHSIAPHSYSPTSWSSLMVCFLLAFPPISYMHSLLPHSCYIPCPSHHYSWRSVQVTKLLIMQFSLIYHHFIPFRSQYSPQHPHSTSETMLRGSLVTTTWRVLRLRMEETVSRYGG
jgi:hypothetical protein